MLIRETFFDSIDFAVINEYDKGTVIQIPTLLGHVYHVACRRVLSNGAFWQLSNTFSESVISKYKIYGDHLFFQSI